MKAVNKFEEELNGEFKFLDEEALPEDKCSSDHQVVVRWSQVIDEWLPADEIEEGSEPFQTMKRTFASS